ncbi:ornithine--oxo-acid transaminase [Peribacillus simplex]|jgi:ornithine--oxo-acid transaminase|uniref:Ornithine aminotransferase n=2 Tax=Peribacillus TaxID=2675229 RepID=A0A9W4KTN7_9BACI|nr:MULTISPECIES: ornithine--oxo-acid transaminase [Bacillaceae]KOR80143.1 ornithine--oxo-acid aminotransferase [Bacillus sp. FJAT-21352]KOR86172.1 ornithine--oxo-acid aminotransferase [Bacillus sp. FJAT-22058]KRF54677.1 ornithine--oxo-acid aminotransferase [Bacillus sp. Soil745]MBD8134532.1 ornithine--oxo-acid transaminase [Bacillus sp. CFBP 13597]MBL3644832.1 ornithine--oxo-acid transaminase [Bacillus sp. RHFB]MBT2601753.1 ornithine--oxo-acid transaminase [Bacillus sp. ISL-53]MCD1158816.1 o
MTTLTEKLIEQTEQYGANNYNPLPIVISKAEGVWVEDPEGNKYMDMLSAYSAVNQGHRHPKIIDELKKQADRVTLTSRAFHSDKLGPWYEMVSRITQKDMALPMNTGAEAVETAIKAVRRWGYDVKGIAENQAEIIACIGNFHGRTMAAVSLSSDDEYRRGFGPMLPGIKLIPYGDLDALKEAITPQTAGFLIEPIQGEAGIIIPPQGFLKEAYDLCKENNVLFVSDEIQSGLGRSGKMFASDWDGVVPDMYILGKALGGGVFPISCVAANREILGVFNPGSHGSTFGGNPLACAVSIASLEVLEEEKLAERSLELGQYFMDSLKEIKNPMIKDIRGRGLFIGVELTEAARPYCEQLKEEKLLCKETHDTVIRFAPPLVITKEDLDWAIERIKKVLS